MAEAVYYGEFDLVPDILPPETRFQASFQPIDLTTFWKRCGLTADYLAEYMALCFDGDKQIANKVSTVFNELIENGAKFSRARDTMVDVDVKLYSNLLFMEVTNYVSGEMRRRFEAHVKKLLDGDPEQMYFSLLESKSESDTESGLGLLMLYKDYPVRFGYRLEQQDADTHQIVVRAFLQMEE